MNGLELIRNARLNAWAHWTLQDSGAGDSSRIMAKDIQEVLTRLTALESENAQLREALDKLCGMHDADAYKDALLKNLKTENALLRAVVEAARNIHLKGEVRNGINVWSEIGGEHELREALRKLDAAKGGK